MSQTLETGENTEMSKSRIVTISIAVINILMWIINIIAGGGSAWGLFISGGGYVKEYGEAAFGYIFGQGQWWRLLTCGYLHMGIIHLACNMYALYIIGTKMEEALGSVKTAIFYNLGIMITAFIWCLIFRNGSTVGASLGIFTLMGLYFLLCIRNKKEGKSSLSVAGRRYLICYAIIGCFLGMGTIVVHLIGFCVGALLGMVIRFPKAEVCKL